MRNNICRNRNIGTGKQGYGQNNQMTIAEPVYNTDIRRYYERLTEYEKVKKVINGHEFVFVIEKLRPDSYYACTVADVAELLKNIPSVDYGDLKYILFRQSKRKEKIISCVWGRLIYSYEFEGDYYPAIILESIQKEDNLRWKKNLSTDELLEFKRLKSDGHVFREDKRYFTAQLLPENVRSTQLYRTVLHEFGHYVHYLNTVERPGNDDENYEEWEKRRNYYHKSIPTREREAFAHTYAQKIKDKLMSDGIIPFDRLEDNSHDLEINT